MPGSPRGETSDADATFEFDANFMLRRSRVSEAYWVWHQELERTGKITHTAAECPDRRGLPIREWTPVAGWRELSAR